MIMSDRFKLISTQAIPKCVANLLELHWTDDMSEGHLEAIVAKHMFYKNG